MKKLLLIGICILVLVSLGCKLETAPGPEVGEFKDFSDCENAEDGVVCMNSVAYKLALEELDMKYCEMLDGQSIEVDVCKKDVLRTAAQQQDPLLCDDLVELKRDCWDQIKIFEAVDKGDIDLCDKIMNLELKQGCKNSLTPVIRDCSQFPTQELCEAYQRGEFPVPRSK